MSKRVAIVQSNYIPWKGYFDLIAQSDVFVLYDEVQYTRRDWRNRNQIKTPEGLHWLTVPVKAKGKFEQTIRDTHIESTDWAAQHLKSLQFNYGKAPHYDEINALLAPVYAEKHTHLSRLNRTLLETICDYLGITTPIRWSWEYDTRGGQTERLVDICKAENATTYISGPAAQAYLDTAQFEAADIKVEWADYSGYPEYPQLWGAFSHYVSIVDLLCNVGQDAPKFMKLGQP